MRNSKQLAILNFIFIVLNLTWIVIIDRQKFFGHSIYETFIGNWTYLTPHKYTFFIWSIVSICLIITHGIYVITLKKEDSIDELSSKISNTGYMIMLNQVLLGLSMVTKLNDFVGVSLLHTIGCLITLININKNLMIFQNPGQSVINYITRITYGLYTGWLIYVALFNSASYLFDNITFSPLIKFIISLFSICILYTLILLRSLRSKLPSYIFGFSFGIIGSYFYLIEAGSDQMYTSQMMIILQALIYIMITAILYITIIGIKNKKEIHTESLN